jgi:hypothetical protein
VRRHTYSEAEHTVSDTQLPAEGPPGNSGLPNRLMTAFEVAEFVGCHEETVRRAYLRGLLVSQRFGVRSRRFHPRGRPRLDRSRRPNTSLVNRKEQSMKEDDA